MKKCDVCNKTTILPENIGSATICKICLLKINGIMWKYKKIEDGNILNKYRDKALSLAKKYNYPDKVITGINEYFISQESSMKKCEACGISVLLPQKLGKTNLCKKCYDLIDIPELKRTKYFDQNELNKGREKVLKVANDNNFPLKTINYINEYFDKKLSNGWLYTLNGGKGQILRVYSEYITITTTESFNEEEINIEYKKLIHSKSDTLKLGSEVLNEITHLRNPLSKKNIVRMATDLATNKFNSSKENMIDSKRGDVNLKYSNYDYVCLRLPEKDENLGFILLRNTKARENGASDIFFFFNNSSNVKKKVEIVYPVIEGYILKSQSQKLNSITQDKSLATELRELKSLLDDGIITEEEFTKKKKQLLNL